MLLPLHFSGQVYGARGVSVRGVSVPTYSQSISEPSCSSARHNSILSLKSYETVGDAPGRFLVGSTVRFSTPEMKFDAQLARDAQEKLGDAIVCAPYNGPMPFDDTTLPRRTVNYCTDYEPSMPNEYASFCRSLKEWRRMKQYDERESESEEEDYVPRRSQFAPPAFYSHTAPRAHSFARRDPPPGPPPQPPPSSKHLFTSVESHNKKV